MPAFCTIFPRGFTAKTKTIIIISDHIKITTSKIIEMVRLLRIQIMLTYSFTDIGSDTLYGYLYKCLKDDILQGVLAAGSRLPSKRAFAENLGVSTITVENAYSQLMAEGYIYALPKKGYFVAELGQVATPARIAGAETEEYPAPPPSYFADFVSNSTNSDVFPFSVWAKIMRETISLQRQQLLTNSPPGGIAELRQAIAAYLYQFRAISVDPQQIIIGAGTEYLYGLLIQLLGRDKIFAVEDPGYRKIAQIYASYGVDCRYVPLDNRGVDLTALEQSGAEILHISPSHHFPTGIITPISRRYQLLGWAVQQPSRYILEDDYDCEFRMLGQPIPALQSIDCSEKVIYLNTFSKSLASTFRISYMVLPRPLLRRFYQQLGFYSCTVSTFEQYTLAAFIADGYFEKHVNRMRTFYHNQRDILLSAIKNSPLSSAATIHEEDSGLHFLLHLNTKLSDKELVQRAAEQGIRVSCLSQYYHQPRHEAEHTLIINYSGIATNRITEAIERLACCLR